MPHFWRLGLGLEDLSCWLAELIFWIWTAMEVETDVALWHPVNWKGVWFYNTRSFVHKNGFKNALVDRWANIFDQKCHEQRKNVTQCRIITLPASMHPNRPHTAKLQSATQVFKSKSQVGNSSRKVRHVWLRSQYCEGSQTRTTFLTSTSEIWLLTSTSDLSTWTSTWYFGYGRRWKSRLTSPCSILSTEKVCVFTTRQFLSMKIA